MSRLVILSGKLTGWFDSGASAAKRGLLLWGFLFPALVYAQCCSPGNPIGGSSALGINEAESWRVFWNYRYGYAGQYFSGREPSTTAFIRDGSYHYSGMILSYGLTRRMTIEAESGYFLKKSQRYAEGIIPAEQSGSGLTDLNLLFRFNLLRRLNTDWEISTGLGFKAPLGNAQQRDQGALIPRDLQPSTGAFDLVHTSFFYKGMGKFRSFLTTRFEYKGTSPDQYRFGHFFTAAGFVSYAFDARWVWINQLRVEVRGRDSRPESGSGIPTGDGREWIVPTGSQKVFWVPQLSFAFSPRLQLSLLADLPLYQYYNGSQLGSSFAAMLSLGYAIGKDQRKSLQIP